MAKLIRRPRTRTTALGLTAVLLGALIAPLGAAGVAFADVTAVLGLQKTASASTVAPGETFEYTLAVSCGSITDVGCHDATLVDTVPAEFEILGVSASPSLGASTQTVDGQTVSVSFTTDLGDGTTGIADNVAGTVTISARLRADTPYEANGVPLTNTATVAASNADTKTAAVDVTPVVELKLATTTSKSFSPTSGPNNPGEATSVTLGGTNTSNAAVETLTISDPADPTAFPSAFDYLAYTSLSSVSYPANADTAVLELWDGSNWIAGPPASGGATPTGPPAPAPADALGFRIIFSSTAPGATIEAGAQAGVVATLEQRPEVAGLTASTTVRNTVSSTVALGDDEQTATGNADYRIIAEPITVEATKKFEPEAVTAGGSSTVTLGATNTGETELDTLTIREPASGSFTTDAAFTGFVGTVLYPEGADSGTIVIHYLDDNGVQQTMTQPVADGDPYPTLPAGSVLSDFELSFTAAPGEKIISGASTTVSFTVQTDAGLTPTDTIPNVVGVDGSSAGATESDTAEATLTIVEKKLVLETGKKINPGQIIGVPGQHAIVQLPTQLLSPESTTGAKTITVRDPQGDPADSEWWQYFDATAITRTDVPAGSSLTVRYYDTSDGTWKDLPGAVDVVGQTTFSMDIPEDLQGDIGGLEFVFTSDTEFPPGTTLQPNFSAVLTESIPPAPAPNVFVENCSSAAATAPGDVNGSADGPVPCPEIELIAPTPGAGDLIDKNWQSDIVSARSHEQATARLDWSTGGYNSVERVVIADVANPPSGPAQVAASVYQAFNLVAVDAITPDLDPLLQYDIVTAVRLWDGTAWTEAANSPCDTTTQCRGTLPRIELTAAEQASTTSVQLSFTENFQARQNATAPDAPLPGSGVASSVGNNRHIDLLFEVRDQVRVASPGVNPDPVLGSRLYNTATRGDVNNTASAQAFLSETEFVRDVASDIISILDRPLNTTVTKGWTGGPMGIPPAGTAAADYPSGRVTIVASNATVARVDTLEISDPAPGSTVTPFEQFDLKDIVTISQPAGTTVTSVRLARADGTTTSHTRSAALALTPAQLADVVGITVMHNGRIEASAKATLTLDLRLRQTERTSGAAVTVADSPIHNDARSTVHDLGGVAGQHTASASDDALMRLENLDISVLTTKVFSPQTQKEPNNAPVLMTLSARPGGSARTASMVVTDDSWTFWNAFDFVGFDPSFRLAAPITRVKVDYWVGSTFSAGPPGNGLYRLGGSWVEGTTGSLPDALDLPSGVSAADVQGLRFTFTRADGSQWENPANPLQQLPILVERRADFRSGGPNLPAGLATTPAPGERPVAPGGLHTNTVDAAVTSFTDGAGSQPLTAEHSTTSRAFYVREATEVAVVKGPLGAQKPGEAIPFTLDVTNTSPTVAIVDPIISDMIPTVMVDGVAVPQLVFDPDATDSPYSYEDLVPPSSTTPGALPMPTNPSDVTVDVNADQTRIDFSFPPGTVLEPGESYRITIKLMFRPGTVANTNVTNGVEVTATRPFTSCNGSAGLAVGACAAETTVYPVETGALRGHKYVRADDTELGLINYANPSRADDCEPAPGPGDFYDYPCVPITKPGATETWREALQNTGTQPLDQIVTIDRLPTPGDSGAQIDLPRGSEWAPRWEGNLALVPGARTPVLTGFYSSAADPCTADLTPTGAPCDPGDWQQLTDDVDPAAVKHIKTVFDFGADPLLPGEVLEYTFQTRTPALSPAPGPDSIAWNTVATGARTMISSGGNGSVLPSEGHRVGVALATGSLEVVKQVTGAGARFAPGSFAAQLQCVSAVGTPVEAALPAIDLVLVNGVTQQVDGLPWGAECELSEGDLGQTDHSSTTATVGRSDEPLELVTLTNEYSLAAIDIVKTIDSAAVDQDGAPVGYGPFEVAVSCTFLGQPVFATGYSAASPMVKRIAADEHWLLRGLPARAECTVTETDAKGAAPTITVTTDDGAEPPVVGNSATVTLTPLVQGLASVRIAITNGFDVGGITVEKVVTGPGAADFGAGPFTVQLVCTLDDASGSRTVWDGELMLGGGEPLTASVDDIAAGALCTATETDAGGADVSEVSPSTPTAVGAGQTIAFTVTNTFLSGALHVVKERTGDGAELYGAGPFTVSLSCVAVDDAAVAIPGGAERVLDAGNGYAADYASLPNGATCSLTETQRGGASESSITGVDGEPHTEFVVQSGATAELVVENRFDVGAITVTKEITGSGAVEFGDRSFTVELSCMREVNGEAVPVAVPGGAERTLSKAGSLTASYEMLPLGAECTLAETSTGGAVGVEITPNAGDPLLGVVKVAAGEPVEISVVNTFDATPPVVPPADLSTTGVDPLPLALGALAVLLLGGGLVLLVSLRRRSKERR